MSTLRLPNPAASRRRRARRPERRGFIGWSTANLLANIPDFRGFDSSIILTLRGGIPRPMGNLQEGLSQAILVGIILVERLGVTIISTTFIS